MNCSAAEASTSVDIDAGTTESTVDAWTTADAGPVAIGDASAPTTDAAAQPLRFLMIVAFAGVGLGMTAPLTVLFARASVLGGSRGLVDRVEPFRDRRRGNHIRPEAGSPSAGLRLAADLRLGSPRLGRRSDPHCHDRRQGVPRGRCGARDDRCAARGGPVGTPAARRVRDRDLNAWWFGGLAAGPLLGGAVAQVLSGEEGYRLGFLVSGAVCFGVAVAARLALPAMPGPGRPRLSWPRPVQARPGGRIWPSLALAAVGQVVRGSLVPTVILLLATVTLGLDVLTVGIAMSVLSCVDVLTLRSAGRLADRVGRRRVLVPGLVLGSVVCVAVPLLRGPVTFGAWWATMAVALAITWVVPTTMVVDQAADPQSGVSGYRILSDGAQLVGPVGAGAVVGAVGPVGAVLTLGALLGAAGLSALLLPRSRAPAAPGRPHRTHV